MKTPIKQTKSTGYHHGDLPSTLIALAVTSIEAHGIERLSLRDLARELGVSHAAPYRHFSDKRALLAAIATEGFTLLFDKLQVAFVSSAPGIVQRIENMAYAYVTFAISHPVYLKLMFGAEFSDREQYGDVYASSEALYGFIRSIVETGQKEDVLTKGDVLVQTATAWSMLHGLALLLSSKRMKDQGYSSLTTEQLTRDVMRTLFTGLLKKTALSR